MIIWRHILFQSEFDKYFGENKWFRNITISLFLFAFLSQVGTEDIITNSVGLVDLLQQ